MSPQQGLRQRCQLIVAPLLIHAQRSEALLQIERSVAPHLGLPSRRSVKGSVASTCSRIANPVMNMSFTTNSLYPGPDSTSQIFSMHCELHRSPGMHLFSESRGCSMLKALASVSHVLSCPISSNAPHSALAA